MSPSEFAQHIDRVPGYITQLKDAGRLVMDGDKINVEASMQLIDETKDPGRAPVADRHQQDRERKHASAPLSASMDDMNGKAGSAYQQARAMREKYGAMQAKIAYEKEVGLLLVASEVKMALADGDAIIRNRLESLPDILAPQLAAEKDEQKIRAILADQVEYLLDELSRTFYSMSK
jgi:hypothetical protein